MRLTFINVRAFANSKGYSVERHATKGFRVWLSDSPKSRFGDSVFSTLSKVKAFVLAECGEGEEKIDAAIQ